MPVRFPPPYVGGYGVHRSQCAPKMEWRLPWKLRTPCRLKAGLQAFATPALTT